ncbi:hypothetical protein VTN02DRAFT_2961 [Thermoascus thermophilus]
MNPRPERYYIHARNPLDGASSNRHDLTLQQIQSSPAIAYALATGLFLYCILVYLGALPFTVSQALWYLTVYLTPSRIVFALDGKHAKPDTSNGRGDKMNMSTFQAKSEAMRRILGLDGSSFYSLFPRARSLSGLGNALLGGKETMPPGLGNWDNSCYQNSIIQGLASLRSLGAFLGRNIEEFAGKGSLSTHIALKDIIERLNSPSYHGQRLWTPPDLKSMSSWQQQDAQEYFSKIVDQIDREILQALRGKTRNLGLKMAGPQEHVVGVASASGNPDDEKSRGQVSEQISSPRNPLEGLLAQRVGCMRCGWTEGLSLIPFNCLTVPLGKNWEYDIRDCLDEYMNLEPIEGVECAKCTLLRTQEQLRHLLKKIEDDTGLAASSSDSPKLSDALKSSAQARLQAVEEALEDEDFAEKTLLKKCHIPSKNRVSTTKSRQAVIARAPKSLVIHVNRSLFDETTGALRKNYADVRFPKTLNLNEWCLGTKSVDHGDDALEKWDIDPQESMLPRPGTSVEGLDRRYELRAVITHYGRHENGHYICYRKYPLHLFPATVPEAVLQADGEKERSERWFRLSDDDVQMVSERSVMSQGGVFMLFYESVESSTSEHGLPNGTKSELGEEEQTEIDSPNSSPGMGTLNHVTPASEPITTETSTQDELSSNGSESVDFNTSVASRTSTASSSLSSPSKRETSADHAQPPSPVTRASTAERSNEGSGKASDSIRSPSMVTAI